VPVFRDIRTTELFQTAKKIVPFPRLSLELSSTLPSPLHLSKQLTGPKMLHWASREIFSQSSPLRSAGISPTESTCWTLPAKSKSI
jgi:hypothetical protein